jgi:hypothetical protein
VVVCGVLLLQHEHWPSNRVEISMLGLEVLIIDVEWKVGFDIGSAFWEDHFDDEIFGDDLFKGEAEGGIEHEELVLVADEVLDREVVADVEVVAPSTEEGEAWFDFEVYVALVLTCVGG